MPKTRRPEPKQSLSIRFPVHVYETVKSNAEINRRSYNDEVIVLIEKALKGAR